MAHPSFVEADELAAITSPLSIAAAGKYFSVIVLVWATNDGRSEIDSIFPASKRHESEQILAKSNQPYQINLWSGVEHGFAVRADITKQVNRFAKEAAFTQAVVWFNEYL